MSEELYPKKKKTPRLQRDLPNRKWKVEYHLAYDGGGGNKWTGYYKTRLGAKISAWWHYHVASWGGSAVLSKNDRYSY